MCGICGFTGPTDRNLLRAMTGCLLHRGPDDVGYYEDGQCSLGVRRLSIIDLEGGHQPMQNEDGSIQCVYNGEIYNFIQIRNDLVRKGHKFATKSDTEVIVHAYEEFGLDAVRKFRGMFALALWHLEPKRLVLARDSIGMKPLYWTSTPDGI